MGRDILRVWGLGLAGALALAGCSLLAPLPESASLTGRLEAFPRDSLPLKGEVILRWDRHQIPFIEARHDEDAAFVLGLVHAHLRLAQMEFLRLAASGRIAEMAGPFGRDIDKTLRILGLTRAVPEMARNLPEPTRTWVERYVAGINHFKRHVRERPVDFVAMNLDEAPWTVEDVVRFSRLAAVDVNWMVYFSYLRLRDEPGFAPFWERYARQCGGTLTSFAARTPREALEGLLGGYSRSGSNSLVLAPSRTATGSALIANDPHLGVPIPNIWLVAGVHAPGIQAVGLMLPGTPFFALGRNQDIAWGGTNMRASSSDLVAVKDLPETAFRTRKEDVAVRFWFDSEVEIRETPYGPVITDAPLIPESETGPLALKWAGHEPSDELTAFYRMNRARNWEEFFQAFGSYAVAGQNFLYADRRGNIGQLMAVRLPSRTVLDGNRLIRSPAEVERDWGQTRGPLQLPRAFNPPQGFLASANNSPSQSEAAVGTFFSADDRISRLRELAGGERRWNVDKLRKLQQDHFSPSSFALKQRLEPLIAALSPQESSWEEWFRAFRQWNGHYEVDSRGAVAYQLLAYHLSEVAYQETFTESMRETLRRGVCYASFLGEDFRQMTPEKEEKLRVAVGRAAEDFSRFANWGDMHRLELKHTLSSAPLIGGRYRFLEFPAPGASETINKTAHSVSRERHTTSYGAQARHISDLSDPDANHFVLLGGQDGWIPSENLLDQVPYWREGRLITVPLRPAMAKRTFSIEMRLGPSPAPAAEG